MGLVFSIVAPVFALIALGYGGGKFRLLSQQASAGISEFAFKLAIPALLFRTIATAEFSGHAPLLIWSAFFGAVVASWVLASLYVLFILRRHREDAPSISMTSSFGNTVMLGLPLSVTTFGHEAAVTVAIILSLHAPFLWLVGTLHATAVRDHSYTSGGGGTEVVRQLIVELGTNPIILAILAGVFWNVSGFGLPDVALKILQLIGDAAIPAALVALGLSLNDFEIKGQTPTLVGVLVLKLLLFPAIAYLLAKVVLDLPAAVVGTILILAACPTGVNAFLFAQRYERAVNSSSGAIALGTVLSAITFSLIIHAIGPH